GSVRWTYISDESAARPPDRTVVSPPHVVIFIPGTRGARISRASFFCLTGRNSCARVQSSVENRSRCRCNGTDDFLWYRNRQCWPLWLPLATSTQCSRTARTSPGHAAPAAYSIDWTAHRHP